MLGEFLITEKHWEGIVNNRYNLKLNGLWHLPFIGVQQEYVLFPMELQHQAKA